MFVLPASRTAFAGRRGAPAARAAIINASGAANRGFSSVAQLSAGLDLSQPQMCAPSLRMICDKATVTMNAMPNVDRAKKNVEETASFVNRHSSLLALKMPDLMTPPRTPSPKTWAVMRLPFAPAPTTAARPPEKPLRAKSKSATLENQNGTEYHDAIVKIE
jgi:hypothetical protein